MAKVRMTRGKFAAINACADGNGVIAVRLQYSNLRAHVLLLVSRVLGLTGRSSSCRTRRVCRPTRS